MTPVGNQIIPPDPQKGLGLMSSILGIQQQRQALQGQAADVQMRQLEARKAQSTQDFFSSWDPTEHMAPDGTTDTESARQSSSYKAAGNAKPDIDLKLAQIKQSQLQNKMSLTSLNGANLTQYGQVMQSLAQDPDVLADKADPVTGVNAGRAKVDAALANFSKLGPDAQRVAQIYSPITQHAPPGKLGHGVQSMALQGQDIAGQQSQTNPVPTNYDTGDAILPATVNRATGRPTLTGQRVEKGIAPSVISTPSGPLARVGGSGSTLTPLQDTGAGPQGAPTGKLQPIQRPGMNAPAADQANYNARIKAAGDEYEAVKNSASDPQNGTQVSRYRNSQILDLTKVAPTGPGKDIWNHIASQFSGESGDSFQKIGHYLAQNSAALAQSMGVPGTNLGAETAAAAAGNTAQNPKAIAEITRTNDALNTARDLYNRGLAKVTGNGSDMSKVAAYKQAFGTSLDVNALRWADAHRRKDTEEIESLRKQFGDKGIAEFTAKLKTLKALADTGDLP
jgi:hypothetical protein